MVTVLSKLTPQQKDVIQYCGFASLLTLKCTSLPNKIILWLVNRYNMKSRHFKIGPANSFKIDAATVHQFLGIPYGGKKFAHTPSAAAKAVILKDTQSKQAAKIEDLINMINDDLVGDKFARIFMLIVLARFLCPSSNPKVSFRYYEGLTVVRKIKEFDWCSIVLDELHKGIVNYHLSACKGNSSGTGTLAGCLFIIVGAYFDYLHLDQVSVPRALPRISVYHDKIITSFCDALSVMEDIQLKPIEDTMFTMSHMDPSKFRGFSIASSSTSSKVQADHHNVNNSHEEQTIPELRTPLSKTTQGHPEFDSSIFESARKVMPGASNLSLRVLCGKAVHPEVDLFIRDTIGTEASQDELMRMKTMCQVFFKDSVQKYLESLEPVLVSQTKVMVNNFWTGLQQARSQMPQPATNIARSTTDGISTRNGIEHSEQEVHASKHAAGTGKLNDIEEQGTSSKEHMLSNKESTDSPTAERGITCTGCRSEIQDGQEHICNAISSATVFPSILSPTIKDTNDDVSDVMNNLDPIINNIIVASSSNFCSGAKLGSVQKKDSPTGQNCSAGSQSNHPTSTNNSANLHVDPILTIQAGGSQQAEIRETLAKSVEGMSPSINNNSPVSHCDKSKAVLSSAKSKRDITVQGISVDLVSQSPQKKLKPSCLMSQSDGGTKTQGIFSKETPQEVPSGTCTSNSRSIADPSYVVSSPESNDKTGQADSLKENTKKKQLSALGHKKRALKAPDSLLKGEKNRAPKVVLSELDSQIYHAATKRPPSNFADMCCADIGRFSIKLKEFGDTMRPHKWIGTFVMNVYTEALTQDQNEISRPTPKKGFLTSMEIDNIKVNGIDIEVLKDKFNQNNIGFKLNEVDMVMIPVVHGGHWWLVVANVRDNRFDVLSSLPFTDETRAITETVKQNFTRVFEAMCDPDTPVRDFPISYQDAPQQTATCDCGVYVMKFLSSWDGRRVAHIDDVTRASFYSWRRKVEAEWRPRQLKAVPS